MTAGVAPGGSLLDALPVRVTDAEDVTDAADAPLAGVEFHRELAIVVGALSASWESQNVDPASPRDAARLVTDGSPWPGRAVSVSGS